MKQIRTSLFIGTLFISLLFGHLFPATGFTETCENWVAKVVSVQGSVQVRRAGETQWVTVALNDTYCVGDMIRVRDLSRAAVVLSNEAVLRLDQKTTIVFSGQEQEQTLLLKLLKGTVHFFSRIPRSLKLTTPFVNGVVEGTEFLVRVEPEQTFLSIFEGRVAAANEVGSLTLESGQSAVARVGQAPTPRVVIRPRDAVHWALYYPPVLDYRPADFPGGTETDWQAKVRRSIEYYWEGDLARAFSSLEGVPEPISDPRFFTYRAALFLTVGRVAEAGVDIERALRLDPTNSNGFALQSIIAVAQNKKGPALEIARKASDLDPESAVAKVALSYAQQAGFDLQGALDSLEEAVKLDPENGLAWARLADLWLSFGYLDRALEAAQESVARNPHLAHTQTVLGFAYLAQIKIEEAREAFGKAIRLDQAAPLPRLGLGLAKIRDGDLKEGVGEIEIAAALDPNNSLIRSYLGKAYFEEKRTKLDGPQYDIAKKLDPQDPTPWFYDAIRKQSVNRPVEALRDLQKSIELNDNRAIFRSRLLLDEDLAARSASLARIYNNLGFEQLGLVEGFKAVNTDPGNYSAHRFLADTFAALPRHEVARVSELLQSQMLQPINITPVQPQLALSNPFILEGAGPADPSFNEFNPLFLRNRFALQGSGVVGGNDTFGGELVHSAVQGGLSYSLGLFHYETDGFRQNNDQTLDVYNIFAQAQLTHKTSAQAEFRYTQTERGDLPLRFDPTNFLSTLRQKERISSMRVGFRHAFAPSSDLLVSVIYGDGDFDTGVSTDLTGTLPPPIGPFSTKQTIDLAAKESGYLAEVQHLWRHKRLHVTSGLGHFDADTDNTVSATFQPEIPPFFVNSSTRGKTPVRHTNLYGYSLIRYPENVAWTIGGSGDFFEGTDFDLNEDQFNPKLGLIWDPFPATTVRAAVFRVLTRTLISKQTLEPTQVAGFNQFFDNTRGTDSWRYGIGIDQKLSVPVYIGVEFSKRDLEVPHKDPVTKQVGKADWEEYLARAYLNWTPHAWVAIKGEYEFERFKRDPNAPGEEAIVELDTHRIPLGMSFFHPLGFTAVLRGTYVDQKGDFGSSRVGIMQGSDQFWVVDGAIGYRLPKRYGIITFEVRNLLDEEFNFQDMDPKNPVISPERLFLARITLAF